MSDLQPGADDIVISPVQRRFRVGRFESVSLHVWCATDVDALQVAHRDACAARVDVWYADDDAVWRVERFRPTDELSRAGGALS